MQLEGNAQKSKHLCDSEGHQQNDFNFTYSEKKKEKKRKRKIIILELGANKQKKFIHCTFISFAAPSKSPHTFPYRNQSSELRKKKVTITISIVNNDFFLKKKYN